jgi:hypothetical protein
MQADQGTTLVNVFKPSWWAVMRRLYGPEKAKTNFPVSDYATYLGATAGGACDGANVGNGVADVSADAAPPSADAQAMSVDIQALVRPSFGIFNRTWSLWRDLNAPKPANIVDETKGKK